MSGPTAVPAARPGFSRHLLSILLLPFTNTIAVPSVILASTQSASLGWLENMHAAELIHLGITLALLLAGLALIIGSIAHFVRDGHGTLAPWDPPQRLVVTGLYKRCRNPMKTGLFLTLAAESLTFRSAPLTLWFAAFVVVNVAYIRFSEEPGLRRRFGDAYQQYCRDVPRWLPRLHPMRSVAGPREVSR